MARQSKKAAEAARIEAIRKLHPVARRFAVASYRAEQYAAQGNGELYPAEELERLRIASAEAQAEIDKLQGRA